MHSLCRERATYKTFPIATAVPAMRLEQSHSLSYQARMRRPVENVPWMLYPSDEVS